MSKKSASFYIARHYVYKMDQDFLDIQYKKKRQRSRTHFLKLHTRENGSRLLGHLV